MNEVDKVGLVDEMESFIAVFSVSPWAAPDSRYVASRAWTGGHPGS